jgi:NAD(P)-dependent dehydrogenase (short-subunit alcohol dehydrogenase family)
MLRRMHTHLTIITGSSRGLGAALVAQRLLSGHTVLGMARQTNNRLQTQADATGASLVQWPIDLTDAADAAQKLQTWLAGFDGAMLASATLINNAGVVGRLAPLDQVPLAELSQALRVGLEAALLLSAAFLQATRDWPGSRRVLNISSGLGRNAMAGSAAYCAAKAGMDHFSRAVALEQAGLPNPARIVSIAPGVIDTDMQAELRGADPALFPARARFMKLQADGVLVSPHDCAALLLARLDRADFGQAVVADIRD